MKYRHVLVAGPRNQFHEFALGTINTIEQSPFSAIIDRSYDRARGILTIGCVRYLSVTHPEHARGYDTRHTTKIVLSEADRALTEAVARYDREQVTL